MPFEKIADSKNSQQGVVSLKETFEQAKTHLEQTIQNYVVVYDDKNAKFSSKLPIPDEYAHFLWLLTPAQVLPDLL